MTKVKICGLKEAEHVQAAVNAGADFIGLMFAPSKRRITVEEAIELVKIIPSNVKKVGVFVEYLMLVLIIDPSRILLFIAR